MKIPLPKNFEPPKPPTIHDFQEIAIALFVSNLRREMADIQFLKQNKILPPDWELSQQPLRKPNLIHIAFKNGFKIILQPRKIAFAVNIRQEMIPIELIVGKYINAFPQLTAKTVHLNLRRLIALPGKTDIVKKYINETLLQQGDWQRLNRSQVKAEVKFLYNFDNIPFLLAIHGVTMRLNRQTTKPALLFRGTFVYKLTQTIRQERLREIEGILNNYPHNLTKFNQIINQVFFSP